MVNALRCTQVAVETLERRCDVSHGAGVTMVRQTLQDVAAEALPEGFSLRRYRSGDEAVWTRIWMTADIFNQVTPETFQREFGGQVEALPERMYFLCDSGGREVGTATAWFGKAEVDAEAGVVHWVAIVPAMQGQGLAKPLMAAVLLRLKELGYRRSYLITQEARLAAINLYLDLGFEPQIRSEGERAAWKRVRGQLRGSRLEKMNLDA